MGGAELQGEDSGSKILAGVGGLYGAGAGLLAARMAGKYAPVIAERLQGVIAPVGKAVRSGMEASPEGSNRLAALGQMRNVLAGAYRSAGNISPGAVQKAAAAAVVPTTTALAGLGGVAAGAIPGALGVPGFQQAMQMQENLVDPEAYGSSNSAGARYKAPTLQYV
jgi:hypothetical protein